MAKLKISKLYELTFFIPSSTPKEDSIYFQRSHFLGKTYLSVLVWLRACLTGARRPTNRLLQRFLKEVVLFSDLNVTFLSKILILYSAILLDKFVYFSMTLNAELNSEKSVHIILLIQSNFFEQLYTFNNSLCVAVDLNSGKPVHIEHLIKSNFFEQMYTFNNVVCCSFRISGARAVCSDHGGKWGRQDYSSKHPGFQKQQETLGFGYYTKQKHF